MPRGSDSQSGSAGMAGGPISKGLALVVLAALLLLVVMRHLFGSVSISGGVR